MDYVNMNMSRGRSTTPPPIGTPGSPSGSPKKKHFCPSAPRRPRRMPPGDNVLANVMLYISLIYGITVDQRDGYSTCGGRIKPFKTNRDKWVKVVDQRCFDQYNKFIACKNTPNFTFKQFSDDDVLYLIVIDHVNCETLFTKTNHMETLYKQVKDHPSMGISLDFDAEQSNMGYCDGVWYVLDPRFAVTGDTYLKDLKSSSITDTFEAFTTFLDYTKHNKHNDDPCVEVSDWYNELMRRLVM
jgi:hypothetical protein